MIVGEPSHDTIEKSPPIFHGKLRWADCGGRLHDSNSNFQVIAIDSNDRVVCTPTGDRLI